MPMGMNITPTLLSEALQPCSHNPCTRNGPNHVGALGTLSGRTVGSPAADVCGQPQSCLLFSEKSW
jgi:hypothetical protein